MMFSSPDPFIIQDAISPWEYIRVTLGNSPWDSIRVTLGYDVQTKTNSIINNFFRVHILMQFSTHAWHG